MQRCYAEKGFSQWTEDEVSASIRNRGGPCGGGGGSEVLGVNGDGDIQPTEPKRSLSRGRDSS